MAGKPGRQTIKATRAGVIERSALWAVPRVGGLEAGHFLYTTIPFIHTCARQFWVGLILVVSLGTSFLDAITQNGMTHDNSQYFSDLNPNGRI